MTVRYRITVFVVTTGVALGGTTGVMLGGTTGVMLGGTTGVALGGMTIAPVWGVFVGEGSAVAGVEVARAGPGVFVVGMGVGVTEPLDALGVGVDVADLLDAPDALAVGVSVGPGVGDAQGASGMRVK